MTEEFPSIRLLKLMEKRTMRVKEAAMKVGADGQKIFLEPKQSLGRPMAKMLDEDEDEKEMSPMLYICLVRM